MPAKPSGRRAAAGALLLMCILLSATAGTVLARHRSHAAADTPGQFDYYVLSLSWSPAFCLSSPGSPECEGPRRYGFIVHGLWPQNDRGWPEHCPDAGSLPAEVVQGISDLMPAEGLVRHEWSTHGTCSGLTPAQYFDTVRRARNALTIPPPFVGPTRASELPPDDIAEAFRRANQRLPPQSVVVACSGQGAPRLREVHICLSRDLMPRACSAQVLRAECRAASIIVPPIR